MGIIVHQGLTPAGGAVANGSPESLAYWLDFFCPCPRVIVSSRIV
jgi:hypothetical protein